MSLDLDAVRADFPVLAREVHGKRLVYLDSGASSQKPAAVIDAMSDYYRTFHSNIHRGAHTLGDEATAAYDEARAKVARFVRAASPEEIVFTKNGTEALNLVARSWGDANLREGDRIVVSLMEHHANIVPWMMVAERTGALLDWIGLTDDGLLDMDDAARRIDGAKVVACTAVSNVLGTITPIAEICRMARDAGAVSVVDAAQLTPHLVTDVQAIGCDFLAVTGHKMLGPTGVGFLYGRRGLLDEMPPFLGGGEMIENVSTTGFTTAPVPLKFEAGTMPIAEVYGLGVAVDYLQRVGLDAVRAHEEHLLAYALDALDSTFGDTIRVWGPRDVASRSGLITFTLGDCHPHDLATILDSEGVAIRAGHHCAKPLHAALGVQATARASFYLYNGTDDVDTLVRALGVANSIFTV